VNAPYRRNGVLAWGRLELVKTKWDTDFSFTVGSHEVHEVHFYLAQGPAEAVIQLDGIEVLRENHFFGMNSLRRYEITVSSSETHTVAIDKRKAFPYGGLRQQSFRLFVDGGSWQPSTDSLGTCPSSPGRWHSWASSEHRTGCL
jgi:hypothetical protein